MTPTCSVDTCTRPRYRRSAWCNPHYQRTLKHGDPLPDIPLRVAPSGDARPKKGTVSQFYLTHVMDTSVGCRLWPYGIGNSGYGVVFQNGKARGVHVLACTAWHGARPSPQHEVAHECRTPLCWAGEHLSWKTHAENEADKVRDGTKISGEDHYAAKLTAAQVREIRARYARGGVTQTALAQEYDVSQSTISLIVLDKAWR